MALLKEDIAKYVYDPNMVQQVILDALQNETSDTKTIVDPTNPFMMLMELAVSSAQNAVVEPLGTLRKLYPDLAESNDDLYRHLSDSEVTNLFSVPVEVSMLFYVNVKDLRSNGYRATDAKFIETTIPSGTEVTVADTVFTLLNNIIVKLYDTGIVFVEQQISTDDIAVNSLGVLSSGIVSFQDGEEWIAFETIIKQVKKYSVNKAVTPSEGFKVTAVIKDTYYYSSVKYKNNYTNNQYIPINKTHSGDYINRNIPTVFISVMDKNIAYKIPEVYLYNGTISGNIAIDVYETKGELYLPLNKYKSEDFKVNIVSKGITTSEATVVNITIMANSRSVAEGGKKSIPIDVLRDAIINNSTGDIDVPITTENIKQKALLQGFELYKSMDIVTDRVFVCNKVLPKFNSPLVYCIPDIFFNSLSIVPDELPNTDDIYVNSKYMLIKSGTVFKEYNSLVTVVSKEEKESLATMRVNTLLDQLKYSRYYYTPYYYLIDNESLNVINTRVYDLDTPSLTDSRIIGKNTSVTERVNSSIFTVLKTAAGYQVIIAVVANAEFEGLDPNYIRAQISIPTIGNTSTVNYYSTYNTDNKTFVFNLATNHFIDENDYIELTNGMSTVSNRYVSLLSELKFHVYSLDPEVFSNNTYLVNEILNEDISQVTVFNKESFTIALGRRVDYIWNKTFNTYTERMYKKYTIDIPLSYEEDVYEVFEETGTIFNCDAEGSVTNILHYKGDPVLDENGLVVYKHRKGDIILDSNNLPTIDVMSGVVRNLDILMLEYEFKLANSNTYKNYLKLNIDAINNWLFTVIPGINYGLLENTKVLFKSYNKAELIGVTVNNASVSIPYLVQPKVILYSNRDGFTDDEIEGMNVKIGEVIHKHLDNYKISISDMKQEILTLLGGDIVGVKITNIEPTDNSEVFTYVDKTKRLILKKQLVLNSTNELVVKYDVTVSITVI